jgi:hypothetical protein
MNQFLFYKNIVALDRQKHQDLNLTTPMDLHFAQKANFIPILLSELSEVIQELPVVFIPIGENEFSLGAITGLQKDSNLLIRNGFWLGRYIPAFLRRYPFMTLAAPSDTSQFTIVIDEQADCLSGRSIEGTLKSKNPLFEDDKPTKTLQDLIPFLQKFHADNLQTQAFCRRMKELNLLTQGDLAIADKQGKQYQVNGGWLIDDAILKNLDPQVIQEFFQNDLLQKIYQIQFSIKNFPVIIDRFMGLGIAEKSTAKPIEKKASALTRKDVKDTIAANPKSVVAKKAAAKKIESAPIEPSKNKLITKSQTAVKTVSKKTAKK